MKKIIFAILVLVVVLIGCDLDREKVEVRLSITGSDPAHLTIRHEDFGYIDLPVEVTRWFVEDAGTYELHYFFVVYSISDITVDVYEDDILVHTETGTYVNWGK